MKPVVKQTFREQIARELRASVLSGQIPPGSQIIETDLATKFGVSRGPLREALRHLIDEGLLVTVPYTGTYVISLSLEDAREIFSLRVELEILAFKLIWENRDSAFRAEMTRRHDHLLDCVRSGNTERSIVAEIELHSLVYEATEHKILNSIWHGLKSRLQLYWAMFYRHEGRKGPTLDAHTKYVEAALCDDFETLQFEVRDHMKYGIAGLEKTFSP
jgi:DNA-binding GntR family transcriptional regulator